MAQFHGLPSASWALSDSIMLDFQASIEERAEKKADDILKMKPEYYLSEKQIDKLEYIEKQWIIRMNPTQ